MTPALITAAILTSLLAPTWLTALTIGLLIGWTTHQELSHHHQRKHQQRLKDLQQRVHKPHQGYGWHD